MLTEFGRVLIFFLIGVVFVAAGLIVAWLLRPHRPYPSKLSTYECGEPPIGDTRIRFNIRFYVVALIFLIFDVEVVLGGETALPSSGREPSPGAGALVMLAVALVVNNVPRSRRYPDFWW